MFPTVYILEKSKRRTQFSVFAFSYSGIEPLKSFEGVERKSEAREDEGKLGLYEKNERAGDVEMWRHGDRIRRKLE